MVKKITIFDILADIDKKKRTFYDDLPEEVQKAEHPLVLMKWMAGTSDPLKTILLNEIVNPYVFSLHKHKPLVMKLLTICGNGKRTRYTWIKTKKSKKSKFSELTNITKRIYNCSTKHANDIVPLLVDEVLLNFAEQLGYQKEEMTKVKAELRARKK